MSKIRLNLLRHYLKELKGFVVAVVIFFISVSNKYIRCHSCDITSGGIHM